MAYYCVTSCPLGDNAEIGALITYIRWVDISLTDGSSFGCNPCQGWWKDLSSENLSYANLGVPLLSPGTQKLPVAYLWLEIWIIGTKPWSSWIWFLNHHLQIWTWFVTSVKYTQLVKRNLKIQYSNSHQIRSITMDKSLTRSAALWEFCKRMVYDFTSNTCWKILFLTSTKVYFMTSILYLMLSGVSHAAGGSPGRHPHIVGALMPNVTAPWGTCPL